MLYSYTANAVPFSEKAIQIALEEFPIPLHSALPVIIAISANAALEGKQLQPMVLGPKA